MKKKMNPAVDVFFNNAKLWQEEMKQLRLLVLDCGLIEELKWGSPCYTYNSNNVIIINGFKSGCVLSFFKGALINDTNGILKKPGENTQSARVIRFINANQIKEQEAILKTYINEAIEIEKAGLKVEFNKTTLQLADELKNRLAEFPALKTAFHALTPGRQRAYNLYFSAPKQSKTRESRIEKYSQQILDGKGINDCTCGLSRKRPYCDGSHQTLR